MTGFEASAILTLQRGNRVDTYRREADNPSPVFACERIQVTHLTSNFVPNMRPYTFGAEPEWFRQRGLSVETHA